MHTMKKPEKVVYLNHRKDDSNVQLKTESSIFQELSEEKPLPPLVKKFPA